MTAQDIGGLPDREAEVDESSETSEVLQQPLFVRETLRGCRGRQWHDGRRHARLQAALRFHQLDLQVDGRRQFGVRGAQLAKLRDVGRSWPRGPGLVGGHLGSLYLNGHYGATDVPADTVRHLIK